MTDRELMELAAKAVGYTVVKYHKAEAPGWWAGLACGWAGDWMEVKKPEAPLGNCRWMPLHDDGDAFRLLVSARESEMQINVANDGCQVQTWDILAQEDCAFEGDHAAALRRAIVRAVAELGKAKP